MKKEFPKIKKSLKSFILEEDAKVINNTSIKIALTTSFLALNFILHSENVSAKGHHNSTIHNNHIFQEKPASSDGTTIHPNSDLNNQGNTSVNVNLQVNGFGPENQELPAKSISSAHGNHYNHTDGGGKSGFN